MKLFQPVLSVLLLCLISACSSNNTYPVQPDFLKPGDKVALIAPAYPIPDSLVKVCCAKFAERGLEAVVSKNACEIYPDIPGFGFPACHGKRNLPLPEGVRTTMTVSESGTSLRFE